MFKLLISGLTYAEDSFIKLTANDTYAVRTLTETKTDLDVDDLENVTNAMDSPGIVTGGVVSEGTNAGTFKVTAITEAYLRTSASATAPLVSVTLTEQDNQTITVADTTYFVIFTYGTPCTITISETAPNGYNAIPLGKVMKDGSNNVHYIDGGFRFGDGIRKLHQRAKTLRALELESGSAIEYSGTNNFTMETGIVYGGLNEFSLSAYDSATTQFTYVYDDGGTGWTETGSNVIDFAHYDDGDGTLGNIGNNKYSVHYVYKHIDDNDVYVVYGTGSYTLAEAEIQAIIPPTIPSHLADFGCQIGTIIAPQSGGSFTAVIMVTSQFFSGTEVVNHNNLGGLQGGTVSEYYHLTATEHTNNAYTTDKLSAFAATTSAELAGVISDEEGTGKVVLNDSPNITTPTGIKFVDMDDTPSAYTGKAGQVTRVNSAADALEFGYAAKTINTSLYLSSAGSDANDGLSSGTAKATIAGVLAIIPPLYDANITIYVSGTIATNEDIVGKYPNGDYSITFEGIEGTLTTSFTSTSVNATTGTVTNTGASWGVNAYRGKILKNITNGWETIILENSATVITVIGNLHGTVGATDNWEVRDFGGGFQTSDGSGVEIKTDHINLKRLKFTATGGIYLLMVYSNYIDLTLVHIDVTNANYGVSLKDININLYDFYVQDASSLIGCIIEGNVTIYRLGIYNCKTGIQIQSHGMVSFANVCKIDLNSIASSIGINITNGSNFGTFGASANSVLKNGATGFKVYGFSSATNSGRITLTNITAASDTDTSTVNGIYTP